MSLMSDNGDIREDLRVPDSDVGREIETKFEAGDEFMVSVKAVGFLIISCSSFLLHPMRHCINTLHDFRGSHNT